VFDLISKFDPFLASHINAYACNVNGHTSCLSKTICDDFIELPEKHIVNRIINELRSANSIIQCPSIRYLMLRLRSAHWLACALQ